MKPTLLGITYLYEIANKQCLQVQWQDAEGEGGCKWKVRVYKTDLTLMASSKLEHIGAVLTNRRPTLTQSEGIAKSFINDLGQNIAGPGRGQLILDRNLAPDETVVITNQLASKSTLVK